MPYRLVDRYPRVIGGNNCHTLPRGKLGKRLAPSRGPSLRVIASMPIRHSHVTHQELAILAGTGASTAAPHHGQRNRLIRLQDLSPTEGRWGPDSLADDFYVGILTIGTLKTDLQIAGAPLTVRGLAIERIGLVVKH